MLCVAILIIVIILFAVDKSTKQPPSPVQTRVKALEEKVARIGGIEESIAKLQGQQEALQKSIARLEGSLESFTKDLRNATRKIEQLKKRQAGLSGQGKKTGLVRKKGASQTRRRYHVVQRGESLYKIAKKYGISLRELYRLNHLSSKSVIYPGQKLVVGPAGKK
ncbi:MAG: LysM peptidoglycan-binding domain-containing protein [Deltaproteobacteria bacterium]|nr:LysM peptidoglycan-binding domain-containing protein [Deltaproteobacteria bacterium]